MGTIVGSYNNEASQIRDYFLPGPGRTVLLEQYVIRDRDGVVYEPDQNRDEGRVLRDRELSEAVAAGRPRRDQPASVVATLEIPHHAQDVIR